MESNAAGTAQRKQDLFSLYAMLVVLLLTDVLFVLQIKATV